MMPIWNFQKTAIFFKTLNSLSWDSWNSPILRWHGFCMTADVMCKNEEKREADKQWWKALVVAIACATSCKEIVCSNTKEHIKWVTCQAIIFLSFWLHLDSLSFKIVSKFIWLILMLSSSLLLVVLKTNLKIVCYRKSDSFLLFINNYCWPKHAIPWAGTESYWSYFYLADSAV